MAPDPGTRIGPYELLALLGEGGMGQVYRAWDERLGREVAVKLLPEDLRSQPALAQRLLQEARAAGRLDHPNILAVHDVGTHEGQPYMVSELLEGRSLRHLMGGQPLPLRKALNLALQLAQGLAAAHAKGIVHRDLKPENLFVANDQRLKILDFGLAKQPPVIQTGAQQPMNTALTAEGMVIGTLAYMAPEQIQGGPLDSRTDLFAFGVVLYEMLSGHRPFLGSNPQEVLFAILKRAPPDLLEAKPLLPPALVQLVERCLEKDPVLRYQSTPDLAHALALLADSATFSQGTPVWPSWLRPRPAWRSPLVAATLAGVLGLGAWLAFAGRSPRALPSFRQMTFRRGTVYTARFAPGATGIIFSAEWDGARRQLFATLPGTLDALSLDRPGTDVHGLFGTGEMLTIRRPGGGFSPGTMARMPLGAGPGKDLLEGVSWADSQPGLADIAVLRRTAGLWRLEYPIGHVIYEYTGRLSYPRISPSGDRVALLECPDPNGEGGSLVTIDRQGRRTQLGGVWKSIEGLGWRRERELWFCASQTGNALWLYAIDFTHPPRLLLRVPGRLVLHDLASDGRVLAERNSYRAFIYGLSQGQAEPRDLSWLDFSELAQLSADGLQVLFTESGDGGGVNKTVYLRPSAGGPPVRLGEGTALCLSADGRQALILAPDRHLEVVPVGAGTPRAAPPCAITQISWSCFLPGSEQVLLWGSEPGKPRRLVRVSLETGVATPVGPEGFAPASGGLAGDGQGVLGTLAGQVVRLALDGSGATILARVPKGLTPVAWGADGRSLIMLKAEAPAALVLVQLATGAVRPLMTLAPGDPAGVLGLAAVSVSADGRRVAFQGYRLLSDLYVIEGL